MDKQSPDKARAIAMILIKNSKGMVDTNYKKYVKKELKKNWPIT